MNTNEKNEKNDPGPKPEESAAAVLNEQDSRKLSIPEHSAPAEGPVQSPEFCYYLDIAG